MAGRTPNAPAGPSGPRHQLPIATGAFTGREDELAELVRLAEQAHAGQSPGAAVICALNGMAGVGKTALAVQAAHRLAEQFPDGQLFIDLHGYTPDMPARDPADALAVVLQALGVTPKQIPAELDARAALYRDRLAGTRTLVLLDNAVNEAQVRPLLPANDRCLVLITSRRRLKALDDAHTLSLDVLPIADAIALLRKVAGPGRVAANDPLLEQIATQCDRLPLALRIAAALVRASPAWNLGRLSDRLRERRPGGALDGFTDGDRNLIAVFDLSLRTLAADRRLLFRRLGLLPGPDADAYATAPLLETDPAGAERLLEDLVDLNLLAETTPGRYRMHDLIRRHARTLAETDPADQRAAAVNRVLDYYQHTAHRADARIARHARAEPAGPAPAHAPALPDPDTARTWLRTERANLLAALEFTTGQGRGEPVVALSAGLASLLRGDGPWPQALALHTAAAAAAERLGDRAGQANALTELGAVRRLTGDYPGAIRDVEAALELSRDLGDRRGQAGALTQLGTVRWLTGDLPGATGDLEVALELWRGLGDRRGQAGALTQLGTVRYLAGDLPGATGDLEVALDLWRGLGDRRGQANALAELGTVRQMTGDYPGAARDQEAALELSRDLGDRRGQANALTYLGTVRRLLGDHPGALRALLAALELYEDLGDRRGQAGTLANLGTVRRVTGDHPGALRDLERALDTFREVGSRGGQAWALNHYAAVFAGSGGSTRALAVYREALDLSRDVGQPDDEALALEGVGECLLSAGDSQDGAAHLHQALEIFRRLTMRPDAERVGARLADLAARRASGAPSRR